MESRSQGGKVAPRGGSAPSAASPRLMLALATVGFALNFWAWALLGPLGATNGAKYGLSAFEVSVVVAVPVVVGSLGRILAGAYTDRLGARVMFPLVTILTVIPVLFLGFVADSFLTLVLGGVFLGLGGTTFAIGVPFVNNWFPPAQRGTALGVFGMGTAGTAVAAFTTVAIYNAWGKSAPFVLVAGLLTIFAVVSRALLRDSPAWTPATGSPLAGTAKAIRLRSTWELCLLYAIAFGGFVAFSVYLPTYLVNAYGLSSGDAARRTAGFVVLAVMMRPVGGWLSDRWHPVPVLTAVFTLAAGFAGLAALEPALIPAGTIAFLGLAAVLGAGSGATFALVSRVAPAPMVGSVTGVVGAAGGLGGFFPPLVMGAVYGAVGDYSIGFILLMISAVVTAAVTWGPVRTSARA